jgi:hypothetical protein
MGKRRDRGRGKFTPWKMFYAFTHTGTGGLFYCLIEPLFLLRRFLSAREGLVFKYQRGLFKFDFAFKCVHPVRYMRVIH